MKYLLPIALLIFLMVPPSMAVPVDITGKVVDTDGAAVANALVQLAKNGLADTTDADGNYEIKGEVSGITPRAMMGEAAPSFQRGLVAFDAARNGTKVSLSIYNLKGEKICTDYRETVNAGSYSFNPLNRVIGPLPSAVCLVRLTIGREVYTWKLNLLLNPSQVTDGGTNRLMLSQNTLDGLAKTSAAVVDTLVAQMINFATLKKTERIEVPLIGLSGEMDNIVFFDDMDNDGLTDYQEIYVYGTSMVLEDTDGDGWDDEYEAVLFDEEVPEHFNPLMADIPSLRLEIIESPEVQFNYTTSSTELDNVKIVDGATVTKTNSWSSSTKRSFSMSHNIATTMTTGVAYTPNPAGNWGVTLSASVKAGGSYGNGLAHTISGSQAVNNKKNYQEAMGKARTNGIVITGGTIKAMVRLHNPSPISCVVSNLTLISSYMVPKGDAVMKSFADNLTSAEVEGITIPPGGSIGEYEFKNNKLTLDQVKDLLNNANQFFTDISGYSLSALTHGGSSSKFVGELTTILAQTANVSIDYGPYNHKPFKKYNISTVAKYHKFSKTNIQSTLRDMLNATKIPYTMGPDGAGYLLGIDGVDADEQIRSEWFAIVEGVEEIYAYPICHTKSNIDSIRIGKGDIISFVYSRDRDLDGVPERLEHMYSISDDSTDTDGDGLSDSTEVFGWSLDGKMIKTDPSLKDTDGDGEIDPDDADPLNRTRSPNSQLDSLKIIAGTSPVNVDLDQALTTFGDYLQVSGSTDSIQIILSSSQILSSVKILNTQAPQDTVASTRFGTVNDLTDTLSAILFPGENFYTVITKSDDGSSVSTYLIGGVSGTLPTISTWTATRESVSGVNLTLGALSGANTYVNGICIVEILNNDAGGTGNVTTMNHVLFAGDVVDLGPYKVHVDTVIPITDGINPQHTAVTLSGLYPAMERHYAVVPYGKSGSTYYFRNPSDIKRVWFSLVRMMTIRVRKIEMIIAHDDYGAAGERDIELGHYVSVYSNATGWFPVTPVMEAKYSRILSTGETIKPNQSVEVTQFVDNYFRVHIHCIDWDGSYSYNDLIDVYRDFATVPGLGVPNVINEVPPLSSGTYTHVEHAVTEDPTSEFKIYIDFEWEFK